MTGAQMGDFGRPTTPAPGADRCRACGAPDHPSGCAIDLPNILASASGADRHTLRDQLAEALETRLRKVIGRSPNPEMVRELTEAGLPVVKRAQAEAAAEAITDLCDDLDHGPLYAEATRYFADRAVDADGLDVARIIRAAALRSQGGAG